MQLIYTRKKFFLLLIPAVLFFTIYQIVPIFVAFYYSFTNFQGLGRKLFIGFKNYGLLFHNSLFWLSFQNTFIIMAVTLLISVPFSFLLALIVNRKFWGTGILKVIFFAPNTISLIVSGLIWSFILDPSMGLVNTILKAIGLKFLALQWIGGTVLTPYSVAVVQTWIGSGFMMMIFLTGLKLIPQEILESSRIDGAGSLQQLFRITIPMLRESYKIIIVLSVTGGLRVFETIYVLTGGGPNHRSESIVSFMYNTTFISHKYGYGMAVAVVEFLVAALISVVFLTLTKKDIEE